MKHSLLYGLAVSSLLLFSCSKEEMPDYGNEANEPMPLTLENVTLKDFDAENPSRASYNQDAATVFVQNDKLGLILLKEDNTRKSHISFTYNANENKWTQDGNAEYLSGDVKKIIAYFPYNETLANDVNSVEALKNAISLTEDQSSLEDFKKNDLLISEITAPKRKPTPPARRAVPAACIGAAGTALYPLLAVSERQGAFYINFYMNGRAEGKTPSGERVIFECKGDPSGENFAASIRLQKPEAFSVYLRIPAGGSSVALCEGESPAQETGYYLWTRSWRDGDKIVLKTDVRLKEIEKNGKAAYTYGPFVLARDEQKEPGADIARPFTPLCKGEELAYSPLAAKDGEQLRLLLKTTDGEVLLTDYASCGKDWEKKDSRISVWFERESAQAPG